MSSALRVVVLASQPGVVSTARRALNGLRGATPTATTHYVASLDELTKALVACVTHVLVVHYVRGLDATAIAAALTRHRFNGRVLLVSDETPELAQRLRDRLSRDVRVDVSSAATLSEDVLQALVDTVRSRDGRDGGAHRRSGLVGRSPAMQEIHQKIAKLAASDVNVCIYGESGTGKELIARAIHEHSPRREGPFVPLDCTAIPEGLMESQLFGHVRGAFTGAIENREGMFRLAHTGTLFMDELCELTTPLQAKLLRVVQTREFVKVGGTRPHRTDVRLITATNKDPKLEVTNGRFREDLYYRLAVVMLNVPPLRERASDIPLLVQHFVDMFAAAYNRPVFAVDRAAMHRLLEHPWRGNVREMKNVIEQAVVLAEGEVLTELDLFPEARFTDQRPGRGLCFEPGLPLDEVQRRYVLETLRLVGGRRAVAARRLGISLRGLQYKLKSYGQSGGVIPWHTNRPIQQEDEIE